jgi:hypothetical protein
VVEHKKPSMAEFPPDPLNGEEERRKRRKEKEEKEKGRKTRRKRKEEEEFAVNGSWAPMLCMVLCDSYAPLCKASQGYRLFYHK